jgi:membrane protease YdiL (CAAX protease family)
MEFNKINIWNTATSATPEPITETAEEQIPVKKSVKVKREKKSKRTSHVPEIVATGPTYAEAVKYVAAKNAALSSNTDKVKKKKTHWSFRHAIYAFVAGIILQTAVSIPFLIPAALRSATQGVTDSAEVTNVLTTDPAVLFWLQISMYAGWVGFILFVSFKMGLRSLAKDIWLKFRWVRDITLGLAIAVGLRLAEQLLFWFLQLIGADLTGSDNSSVFTSTTGFWSYLLLFGVVSFAGPISEELLFRGIMLQGLLRSFRRTSPQPRTWFGEAIQNVNPNTFALFSKFKEFLNKHKYVLAVIISSTIFGFMHFQGVETFGQWLVVIETGLIGVVLAWVTLKTKRLGLAIFIHIFFNFSGVLLSLFA